MKRLIKNIVLILTLLLIFACFGPEPEPKPEPECKKYVDEFYPISAGNTWMFEKLWYDNGEIDSAWTDTHRYVIENTHITIFQDSLRTISEGYWHSEFQGVAAELKFNGPDGIYYTGLTYRDSIWFYTPQLYYKYPADVGETWPIRLASVGYYFLDTLDMSCAAKEYIYITPYDTFLTTVYHHGSSMGEDVSGYWHLFEYYCYGVGLIGYDVYSTEHAIYDFTQRNIQDLFITYKLIDYCLY